MMAAAAHNPQFASKVGVPQSVAKEYNSADKGSQRLKQALMNKKAKKPAAAC